MAQGRSFFDGLIMFVEIARSRDFNGCHFAAI